MKRIFWLFLMLLTASGERVRAQTADSCGPKSGLCWPKLSRGARGPRVVALQYLLRNRGYNVAADGKFAYATESAVRKFQAKNKLKVDGKIGWQSWEVLTPNLKRGAKGDAVRALQTLLNQYKSVVKRDGIFGSNTERLAAGIYMPIDVVGSGETVTDTEWCYWVGGYWKGENRTPMAD